ncbi:hypothetical protein J2129_001872 [Methanofollis sp. W23]|uniref:hypothetical protein n=1 Tax=Methanofollis sp. W23 TaxID=2817849 RepID=UPI001AE1F202|nr:hypothetical protein [Methanofollis sp. W23]MBP2146418.1 hypothetical protein [Methanofollis sp. W23]
MGREFFLGAVFGEWGADEHDNIFYLGDWIASGVLGDVRDIAATISRGDLVGTGLNLAALIPGYGDISPAKLCHLNPQKEVSAGRHPLLAEILV